MGYLGVHLLSALGKMVVPSHAPRPACAADATLPWCTTRRGCVSHRQCCTAPPPPPRLTRRDHQHLAARLHEVLYHGREAVLVARHVRERGRLHKHGYALGRIGHPEGAAAVRLLGLRVWINSTSTIRGAGLHPRRSPALRLGRQRSGGGSEQEGRARRAPSVAQWALGNGRRAAPGPQAASAARSSPARSSQCPEHAVSKSPKVGRGGGRAQVGPVRDKQPRYGSSSGAWLAGSASHCAPGRAAEGVTVEVQACRPSHHLADDGSLR